MLDLRQGYRILLTAQEPFCAVDGIERPVRLGRGIVIAGVDSLEHLVCGDILLNGADHFDDGVANARVLVGAQPVSPFLARDEHFSEGGSQRHDDDCLHGEVGHGDRAAVVLGDLPNTIEVALHGPGHAARRGHRINRSPKRGIGVVHMVPVDSARATGSILDFVIGRGRFGSAQVIRERLRPGTAVCAHAWRAR